MALGNKSKSNQPPKSSVFRETESVELVEGKVHSKKLGNIAAIKQLMGFGKTEYVTVETEVYDDDGIDVPNVSTATSTATLTQGQFENAITRSKSALAQKSKVQYMLIAGAIASALCAGIVISYKSNAESEVIAAEASIAELDSASRTIGRTASTAALGEVASLQALNTYISRTNGNLANIALVSPETSLAQFERIAKDAEAIMDRQASIGGVDKKLKTIQQDSELIRAYSEQLQAIIVQKGGSNDVIMAANRVNTSATKVKARVDEIINGNSTDRSVRAFSDEMQTVFERINVVERSSISVDRDVAERLLLLKAAQARMNNISREIRSRLNDVSAAKVSARELQMMADGAFNVVPQLQRDVNTARNRLSFYSLIAAVLAITAVSLVASIFLINARNEKRRSAQIQSEKARLDQAIERMLGEIVLISSGDLSTRISVTSDVTGVIADAINMTIGELSRVVQDINSSTTDVKTMTRNFVEKMKLISGTVNEQEKEVQDVNSSIGSLTNSARQISDSAKESYSVSQESLNAAMGGVDVVQKTISGMGTIRENIGETSKRIKRLAESSQEIAAISDLVQDIAVRTNILALNAFLQAASAGEQGRGFRVIASEIQELAKGSGESLSKITGLIQTIQSDMQEAISAMERSTEGVVEGASLAESAGKQLERIREVSERMAELVAGISSAAQNQAEDASEATSRMAKILQISRKSSEMANESRSSIEVIGQTVGTLSESVANFRT